MKTFSQERLHLLVNYDPLTGVFTSRVKRGIIHIGDTLGTRRGDYTEASLEGVKMFLHQWAFLYMTGEIPPQVDHKNLKKRDNRWSNLRPATPSQNQQNMPPPLNNTSGVKGVYFNSFKGKWQAQIKVNYKLISLGTFISLEEARKARASAETLYFGEFAYKKEAV